MEISSRVLAARVVVSLIALLSTVPGWLVPAAVAQTPTRTAYSLNGDGSISVFGVSPDTGTLTAQGVVSADADPTALVIDSSARFLYVASAATGRLQAFAIADADLTPLGSITVNRPVALALGLSGRYLYVAEVDTPRLYRVAIRTDGSLSEVTAEMAGVRLTALTVHPSGRLLYALGVDGRLYVFAIDDRTGTLRPAGVAATGGSRAVAFAIEPRGQYLYVLHRQQSQIVVFRLQPGTGTPVLVQTIGVSSPAAVAIERSGRFLYVASPDDGSVLRYRISPEQGTLSDASPWPLASPAPESLTIDPSNRFLYAASPRAGTVTVLTIDRADGMPAEPVTVPAPRRPMAITLAHARERFLFTREESNGQVLRTLRHDEATGALTEAGALWTFGDGGGMVLDRSGRYLYVRNVEPRGIRVFRVDVATGQLTSIQSISAEDMWPNSVLTLEPTGQFLLISCRCDYLSSATVQSFRIDAATGLLTPAGVSGVAYSTYASSATTDITGRFLYVASTFNTRIDTFRVDQSTGQAAALPPFIGAHYHRQLVPDPRGRFLFAVSDQGVVQALRVSPSTGALTPIGVYSLGVSAAAIDPTGRRLYVTTQCGWPQSCGTLHTLAIDEVTGALDATMSSIPLGEGAVPTIASVDATGRFLWIGRRQGFAQVAPGGFWTFRLDPGTGAPAATGGIDLPNSPRVAVTSGPVK